jgi:hypothetical protein
MVNEVGLGRRECSGFIPTENQESLIPDRMHRMTLVELNLVMAVILLLLEFCLAWLHNTALLWAERLMPISSLSFPGEEQSNLSLIHIFLDILCY